MTLRGVAKARSAQGSVPRTTRIVLSARASTLTLNGYIESFNARLRDELLDGEIFYSLREAQTVIESRRRHYNRIRPHAPEVFVPALAAWPALLRRTARPATLAPEPAMN